MRLTRTPSHDWQKASLRNTVSSRKKRNWGIILAPRGGCSSGVRASDCDSEGRGFETHHPPHLLLDLLIFRSYLKNLVPHSLSQSPMNTQSDPEPQEITDSPESKPLDPVSDIASEQSKFVMYLTLGIVGFLAFFITALSCGRQ